MFEYGDFCLKDGGVLDEKIWGCWMETAEVSDDEGGVRRRDCGVGDFNYVWYPGEVLLVRYCAGDIFWRFSFG